jgi:hypothetical protein
MNRLGGRGGHLVTFDPGPPSPPGHQAQSASLVTRCPPGARSLTRALEIGFFALLLPHGWHLRDGRRGGRAGTARASPNEPSSVSYRSRSVPLSGRRLLVLAGLLMTLRDECPPGTVKIVRGASVVDDAAGTLSIASFVSPLLSLSARSSLECTPRMRVTVDIRTVPSEPPSVACANQLVCPALSQDGRGGGRRGGAGATARASHLGGDQRGQARPLEGADERMRQWSVVAFFRRLSCALRHSSSAAAGRRNHLLRRGLARPSPRWPLQLFDRRGGAGAGMARAVRAAGAAEW